MAVVIHGANRTNEQPELDGQTVDQIRCTFRTAFNIPAEATAQLNGKTVASTARVNARDVLVFAKPTGEKGR